MNLNFDEIIRSYFEQNDILVQHQINSYNEYVNNILPNIISNYFPININFDESI